jgi:hypothetical protein
MGLSLPHDGHVLANVAEASNKINELTELLRVIGSYIRPMREIRTIGMAYD